jgi:zinc protease
MVTSMRILRRGLVSACVALAATLMAPLAAAQGMQSGAPVPAPGFVHQRSDVPVDPRVVWGELPNGMRYAIVQNAKPAQGAVVRLRIGAGSMHEEEDQRGLAHFLEHMAFNGSQNIPEGEMIRRLERLGLAFGPHTNAYTSFDETVYQLDLPNVRTETLDEAFLVMRETADRLLITPEAVERERGVVLAEARARKGPQQAQLDARLGLFARELRLRERLPIGLDSVIQNAPRQRLVDFYRTWYRPDNAQFIFVGDLDPEIVRQRIRASFGDWQRPATGMPTFDRGTPVPGPLETLNHVNADVRASILIGTTFPTRRAADTLVMREDLMAHGLWMAVLNRRLETISRGAGAPWQAAGVSFSDDRRASRGVSASISMGADQWAGALAAMERELRRLCQHGVTAEELARELSEMETGARNSADAAGSRWSQTIADGLVAAFDEDLVFADQARTLDLFLAIRPRMTVERVNAAFADAWGDAEPRIMVTTPTALAADQIEAAWRGSAAVAVTPPARIATQPFAYTDFGRTGRIVSRSTVDDIGFTRMRLSNGIRVNFKRTEFEQDVVRIRASFGGGFLDIGQDRPGLSAAASWLLVQGGLQAHTLEDLERILAGRSWGIDFDVGEDSFEIDAATKPTDFERQMQVLAAYLKAPAFRAEALERYQTFLTQFYTTYDTTPGGAFGAHAGAILRNGDARWAMAPLAAVQAITPDDIRSALERHLLRAPLELTIVGDIEPSAIEPVLTRTFGALPRREQRWPSWRAERRVQFAPPSAEPAIIPHRGDASRAILAVYWPTLSRSPETRRQTRVVSLVSQILELRLIERVREADGVTYSPNASSQASVTFPGFGTITASMELKPEDVDTYRTVIDQIAAAMAGGDITADELERARRPVLENLDQNLQDNGYWVGLLEQAQRRPWSLDDHRTVRADFESITLDEVRAAAATYLPPARAIRIVSKPAQPQPTARAAAAGISETPEPSNGVSLP